MNNSFGNSYSTVKDVLENVAHDGFVESVRDRNMDTAFVVLRLPAYDLTLDHEFVVYAVSRITCRERDLRTPNDIIKLINTLSQSSELKALEKHEETMKSLHPVQVESTKQKQIRRIR